MCLQIRFIKIPPRNHSNVALPMFSIAKRKNCREPVNYNNNNEKKNEMNKIIIMSPGRPLERYTPQAIV